MFFSSDMVSSAQSTDAEENSSGRATKKKKTTKAPASSRAKKRPKIELKKAKAANPLSTRPADVGSSKSRKKKAARFRGGG